MTKKLSIPTRWLKNRSPEEQEALRYSLETNTIFVDTLLDILQEMADEEDKSIENLKDYESPSWPYLRANRDGAKRAYRNVKNLFKTTET